MRITKMPRRRRAFTATQLLIVIGVVALIVGLAFPVIHKMQARQARATSTNNLKDIALAFHGFHDAHRRLPYNGTAQPYVIDEVSYGGPAVAGDNTTGSWAFMILPFIDQKRLFLSADRDTPVHAYMCPGRGRYALCTDDGGPGAWTDYFLNPFLNDPNGAVSVRDVKRTLVGITDGTSNTIFVGHGQINPAHYRATNTTVGFTDIIFNGGSPGMCRPNTKIVHGRDSSNPPSVAGNWGGPFAEGSMMGIGDATVRMFPYTIIGGTIRNGTAEFRPGDFSWYLTPTGGEFYSPPD